MTSKKRTLLRFCSAITLALTIAVFLPATSFADIENLYAEGYSSSVTITNPSNAYGALDGYLRFFTRMGLSTLLGAGLVFFRLNLAEKWPLLVTIAVILSVLLYMEFLIKRHRGLSRKPAPHEGSLSSQRDYLQESRMPRELRKPRGSFNGHRA